MMRVKDTVLAKAVAPKFSYALNKNFTAAPVPFQKSGQTFNVCDHHFFSHIMALIQAFSI